MPLMGTGKDKRLPENSAVGKIERIHDNTEGNYRAIVKLPVRKEKYVVGLYHSRGECVIAIKEYAKEENLDVKNIY